jgi:putative FmdB family regulatory protein
MPIYVYVCKDCDTKVERPQKHKKRHLAPLCQICGKKMKIQLQPASLVFKGGGWTK